MEPKTVSTVTAPVKAQCLKGQNTGACLKVEENYFPVARIKNLNASSI